MLGVIVFEFDPLLHFGDTQVRLETVALAVVMMAALIVAGLIARATPAARGQFVDPRTPRTNLLAGDLLFIAMGALPGAVIGGRIGYVLLHMDYYLANQGEIVDPASGSLELTMAVVGGCLTAAYVLRLLNAPVGRWAHVAAFPLLLALGAGKIVQVLGGDGQGVASELAWATAYRGDGPWGSLVPEMASHPAQLYEGFLVLLVLQVLTIAAARGAFRAADGNALLVGVGLWAVARLVVSGLWRDAAVLGPLKAEQLLALGLAIACFVALAVRRRRRAQAEAVLARELRSSGAAAAVVAASRGGGSPMTRMARRVGGNGAAPRGGRRNPESPV